MEKAAKTVQVRELTGKKKELVNLLLEKRSTTSRGRRLELGSGPPGRQAQIRLRRTDGSEESVQRHS